MRPPSVPPARGEAEEAVFPYTRGAPPSLVGKGAGGLGKSPARTYGLRLCGESFHRRN